MTKWNEWEGSWRKWKGEARQKWGELTDDDLEKIQGRHEVLIGTLQELYGWSREEAEVQVSEFQTHFYTKYRPAGEPAWTPQS